jgi:hypothetical protein
MAIKYPPTTNGLQKTLGAQLDEGEVTSVTLNNTTGIQNKAGVFVVDRIDTGGTEKSASVREYISFDGLSGSTLTGLTRGLGGGGVDQDHATGAVVEFVNDVVQQQSIIDAIVAEHSTAGVHDATKVVGIAGNQTITGVKTFGSGKIVVTNLTVGAFTVTPPSATDTLVGRATTDTLTNKRITPRIVTTTDDATAVIDTDITDQYQLTAVANDTTISTTGSPTAGQKLIIRLTDAGVAKNLTWDGVFRAVGVTLPTVTVATKTHYIGAIYNLTATKWDVVAVLVEA